MNLEIRKASMKEKPIIQNLARFYIYDLSEYQKRKCPENGLYEDEDYLRYWKEEGYSPYLIKCENELAGFALIDKGGSSPAIDYQVGEFFILRKFRGEGIAGKAAREIFERHPGNWEVMALSNNLPAIGFWEKCIADHSQGNYTKTAEFHETEMIVFRFSTSVLDS